MSSRIPWRTRSRMRCSCSTVADSPGSRSSDNARAEPSEPYEPFSQGVLREKNPWGSYCFSVRMVQFVQNYLQIAYLNGSAIYQPSTPNL
jgi:hypothetical protein